MKEAYGCARPSIRRFQLDEAPIRSSFFWVISLRPYQDMIIGLITG